MHKKLYLHVGMHKTGTTSIQTFCWENRLRLKELNLLYPELGLSGANHADFALSLKSGRQKVLSQICSVNYLKKNSPYKKYTGLKPDLLYEQLGEIVKQTNCEKILLSSECFLEWVNPQDVAYLINKYVQCDVKIIFYLRRQDHWIQSVFNQIVKDPYIRYIGKIEEMPQIEMLDYYNIILKWAANFGSKNILVRIYERKKISNDNIVVDFFKTLGLKKEHYSEFDGLSNKANVGIETNGLKLLQALNRYRASDLLYRRVLGVLSNSDIFNYNTASKNILSFKEADNIYKKYRKSNQRISDKYFNGGSLFDPPSKNDFIESYFQPEDIFCRILKSMFETDEDRS